MIKQKGQQLQRSDQFHSPCSWESMQKEPSKIIIRTAPTNTPEKIILIRNFNQNETKFN